MFKQADILQQIKSQQQDNLYLQLLQDKCQNFLLSLLSFFSKNPSQTVQSKQKQTQLMINIIYYLINFKQTIGQEYTYIQNMNFRDYNYQGQSVITKRMLLFILFKLGVPFFIQYEILNRINQAFYFIFNDYKDFSSRIFKIKQISLTDQVKDVKMKFFGLILTFNIIYDLINLIQKNNQKKIEIQQINEINENLQSCSLCFDEIKNCSIIPCGHVYCWDCIMKSLSYEQKCPNCRYQCEQKSIVQMRNF